MKKHIIWTLPTRIFHWGFALSIIGSYITGENDALWWHEKFGTSALGLLGFRIIWGFIGPQEARFGAMWRGWRETLDYIGAILRLKKLPVYPGHNPLGGLSVMAILLVMGAMAISGLWVSDDILYDAPFTDLMPIFVAPATRIHDVLHPLVLVFVGLHLGAIFIHRVVFGERLLTRMLSGEASKSAQAGGGVQGWVGLILIALCLAGAWSLALLRPDFIQ